MKLLHEIFSAFIITSLVCLTGFALGHAIYDYLSSRKILSPLAERNEGVTGLLSKKLPYSASDAYVVADPDLYKFAMHCDAVVIDPSGKNPDGKNNNFPVADCYIKKVK